MAWSESSKLRLHRAHVSDGHDYNCRTDESVTFHPKGPGGPSVRLARKSPSMRDELFKKKIILDYDNVVNPEGTEPPVVLYVKELFEMNRGLGERREDVMRNMRMLEREEDVTRYADALSDIFRKSGLTERQHLAACGRAASGFELVPGYGRAIGELRDMGYDPSILSASPEDLIYSSRSRLGIGLRNVRATAFYFGEDGTFAGMEMNLGRSRSAKRDEIMSDYVMTPYGVEIVVDDNPVSGGRIAKVGWNHFYIWANESRPMEGNVSVGMPELRRSLSGLPEKVRQVERCQMVLLTVDERDYARAVGYARRFVDYASGLGRLSGGSFRSGKDVLCGIFEDYVGIVGPVFPSRESRVAVRLEEFRLEPDEARAKKILSDIGEKFYRNSLESRMDPGSFGH